MKKLFPFLAVFFIALGLPAQAAIEKDLGQSLAYLRGTDAQADLPVVLKLIDHRPVFVLDLRALVAGQGFADTLQAALEKKPAAHALRIILINPTTAPAVVEVLNADYVDVVTLGPKSSAVKPDVEIDVTETEDRRAFAAMADGTPLEKLITDNRDKRRYDEAKLVHDHANGITPADDDLPPDAEDDSVATQSTEGKKASEPEAKPAPAPLLDLVLERAIQLHHSLVALKKL